MRQRTYFLTALLTYMLIFVCVPSGFAQGDQGAVAGVIRDETGAVLPGATITVRHLETEISNSTVSDMQGQFEFLLLPAGDYEVQAMLPGFSGWARPITIEAAASATLNITLDISAFAETVKVTRTDQDRSAVPTAVSVIGRDEIQFAQRQEALAETLRGIPGLFVENRRNFSLAGGVQATIRAPMVGFGMRGIQLLQEGISSV